MGRNVSVSRVVFAWANKVDVAETGSAVPVLGSVQYEPIEEKDRRDLKLANNLFKASGSILQLRRLKLATLEDFGRRRCGLSG